MLKTLMDFHLSNFQLILHMLKPDSFEAHYKHQFKTIMSFTDLRIFMSLTVVDSIEGAFGFLEAKKNF